MHFGKQTKVLLLMENIVSFIRMESVHVLQFIVAREAWKLAKDQEKDHAIIQLS